MSFVYSIAFWGLLTLFVPLVIHLLSKKKNRKIYFGSIVFLESSESPSAKSIRLSDLGLMLLRMLILTLAIFALARPVWMLEKREKIIYVENDIMTDSSYQVIWSEIKEKPYKVFAIEDTVDMDNLTFSSLYTLIYFLNEQIDSSVVYTRSKMKDFKGEKVALSSKISWNILPLPAARVVLDTISVMDRHYGITYQSSEAGLKITSERIPQNPSRNDVVTVYLLTKANAEELKNLLNKSLTAISPFLPIDVEIETEIKKADWVIMVDTIASIPFKTGRVFWESYPGQIRMKKLGERNWKINGTLDENSVLNSEFFPILSKILVKKGLNLEELDLRQLEPETSSENSNVLAADVASENTLEIDHWFWMVIIILIGIERFWVLKKE